MVHCNHAGHGYHSLYSPNSPQLTFKDFGKLTNLYIEHWLLVGDRSTRLSDLLPVGLVQLVLIYFDTAVYQELETLVISRALPNLKFVGVQLLSDVLNSLLIPWREAMAHLDQRCKVGGVELGGDF